jgi:hypothetical protein
LSPQASTEIFSITSASPQQALAHGSAVAYATAEAVATFRRGIHLSAGFDLEAHADASIKSIISGAFTGGVSLKSGLSLDAAFPLDLFTQAGLVARFQVAAEAAAYVQAQLGLDVATLRSLVGARFTGAMKDLCDIFLDEVVLQAGLWARAAFAAEILGQASVTGSLFSADGNGGGFSFTFDYAAGIYYATGTSFVANVGLENPQRLLNRMSDHLTAAIVAEAQTYIATLPAGDRDAANSSLEALKLLLPLAARGCFELGAQLVKSKSADQVTVAAKSIVGSFVAEAQELLLREAFDLATAKLTAVFASSGLLLNFSSLSKSQQQQLQSDLADLVSKLKSLDGLGRATPTDWLTGVVSALGSAEAVVEHGLLEGPLQKEAERALALLWSTGVLLATLASWIQDPSQAALSAFGGGQAAPVPNNSLIAGYVATAIGKRPGNALTPADLVSFLLGFDVIAIVRRQIPVAAPTLDFLTTALSGAAGSDLAKKLLSDLSPPSSSSTQALLSTMGTEFGALVKEQIVPKLIDPWANSLSPNDPIHTLLSEVVAPTLVSLPAVILPNIPNLGATDEANTRFREALSAVLLQSLSHYLLATIDVLLDHALTDSEKFMRDAGAAIANLGQKSPVFALVATVAAGAELPVALTPDDVNQILTLAADIVHLLNAQERQAIITSMQTAMQMGLQAGASRDQSFNALLGSSDPANPEQLTLALNQIESGLWAVAKLALPRILQIILDHYVNEAKVIAMAIYDGAKAVVAAVESALAWLGQEVQQLTQKLNELVAAAGQLVADIASEVDALASYLVTLEHSVLESIRAYGWGIAQQAISWAPGFVQDAAKGVYDALFDGFEWLLEAPLKVLELAADWVHEIVTDLMQSSGQMSRSSVDDQLRQRIFSHGATDISIDLSVDLGLAGHYDFGTIQIPGSGIIGVIAEAILGDSQYGSSVDAVIGNATPLRANQAQQQSTQSTLSGSLNQQQAQTQLGSLTTNQPLTITASLSNWTTYNQQGRLTLRIAGANRSFVDSTLGVPRRVTVVLNGQEYPYSSDQWSVDGSSIVLDAYVVPHRKQLTPQLVRPKYTLSTLQLPAGTTIKVVAGEPLLRYELEAKSADATAVHAGAMTARARDTTGVISHPGPVHVPLPGNIGTAEVVHLPTYSNPMVVASAASDTRVLVADVSGGPMTSLAEQGQGWRWSLANAVGIDQLLPVIVGRPGLNVLQIAVSDGKAETAHAAVAFYLHE